MTTSPERRIHHQPQRGLEELRDCESVTDLTKQLVGEEGDQIAILSLALRGSAGVSREIEQQAKELAENGYDVTLYVLESDMDAPEGVDLRVLGTPSNFYLNKLYQLLYPANVPKVHPVIRELRSFDLLIAHRYPLTCLAYFASRDGSVPYVVWHYHVPNPDAMPSIPQRVFMRALEYLEEESWIVKNADVACSISDSSREILEARSGVDSLVIANDTENSRFEDVEPDFDAIEENYGITSEDSLVLFVGRLTATKNVLELVSLFETVRDEIPNAKLVVAGKPTVDDYYQELQREADEGVVFTGFIPDEELVALYEYCDVYATCSIREGRNLPPGEAQVYGAKVVGFNVPGIRDIVSQGKLAEPENYEQFTNHILSILTEDQ
ncbi:glycosyltransferase family 1 protein [Halorubrum sp. SS5]|nr:glycosyltransferase family 1 protein [Halorubrum sp. SS5]